MDGISTYCDKLIQGTSLDRADSKQTYMTIKELTRRVNKTPFKGVNQ